jgi:hypothetical protein
MLPGCVDGFERGWLSVNNVLLTGSGAVTLVYSG